MIYTNWSQDVYVKAWDFATVAHHGQTYGSPIEGQRIDYINHIGSVAMELMWALDRTENLHGDLALQCALLHDVIEDTAFTYEDVKREFGAGVANGVMALTKNDEISDKCEKMKDSLARIRTQPKEIWMVKLADRITNLSPPPHYWEKAKCISYREEAILILTSLAGANDLLETRLAKKIEEYQQYY